MADPAGPVPPGAASGDDEEHPSYASLWDRVRAGFSMPNIESPLVERHVDWYQQRPDYMQRVVERGRRYLHFVVEELEKRGMPLEIALLPMIESAYNPVAYSKAHASGMWQFIPETGKTYGLKQNWWYDGRRDVVSATRAALDYLQKLHGLFGDWHLALAAYNWGEGAVSRAIERNLRSGMPADYNNLRMPAETRNYLPKLQAVKNIVAEPERYGLALDDVPNEPYFIRVAAPGHIDFKRAAQLAETPLEEFRSLNPAFNRPVITPSGEQSLLVPAEKADIFAENLKSEDGPLLSWQTYRLPRHERVETVAARFRTTPALLRQVNGIQAHGRLKAGSTLLVPRTARATDRELGTSLDLAAFQPPQVVPEARVHRVRKGERLADVAARYGLTTAELTSLNHLRSGNLRPGQRLRLVAGAVTSPPRYTRASSSKARHAGASTRPAVARHPLVAAKATKGVARAARCCAGARKGKHLASR